MSNDEFQKLILEKLTSIEIGQTEIKAELKAVYEQTANLTEFMTETKLDFFNIKDTLRFLLHKEIETEKELF
ncbi:hypothetical protein GC105_11650 [Alkalibaculum sp. M08DMB]|uniref:Uncharacterized protein n=1 Tax=Alkalibaculum sporogenes TaxID=2655001 RepID=A0A6A7KAG9_9FIRM|nr:hypothetical protein [Alkalibaculum sporogenes]MPW26444.1 hypothetical protein [Alkalibaculum sporogenes]